MPNVSNAQFKNIMNISFLVFLNKDANTEEETLTVDENLEIRTQKQKTSQNRPYNNIKRVL